MTASPDLAALRADVLSVLARLDALQGCHLSVTSVEPCDIIEVDEAATIARREPATIRKWATECRHTPHDFGHKLGGRWLLSRRRFLAYLAFLAGVEA